MSIGLPKHSDRFRASQAQKPSTRFTLIATTIALLLLSIESGSPTVRACTLVDPPQGVAGILQIDTAVMRETWFDGVGIGAMCDISNSVDVSGPLAMVEGQGGVMMYDLRWNRDRLSLPSPYARAPRLDQGYLYFLDVEDESLERIDLASRLQERIVSGIRVSTDLEISEGIASWLTIGDDGPRLSVFDIVNRRLILDRGSLPPSFTNASGSSSKLVGIDALNAVLVVEGRELFTYDLTTQVAEPLVQLPVPFAWDVAYDDGTVVYVAERKLYTLDLSQNTTRLVREDFLGVNVAFDDTFVAYNYYVTRPLRTTVLLVLVLVGTIAGAVLVGTAVLSRRRRRRAS